MSQDNKTSPIDTQKDPKVLDPKMTAPSGNPPQKGGVPQTNPPRTEQRPGAELGAPKSSGAPMTDVTKPRGDPAVSANVVHTPIHK